MFVMQRSGKRRDEAGRGPDYINQKLALESLSKAGRGGVVWEVHLDRTRG